MGQDDSVETWALTDGTKLTLRHIAPTDAAREQAFVHGLSPQGCRLDQAVVATPYTYFFAKTKMLFSLPYLPFQLVQISGIYTFYIASKEGLISTLLGNNKRGFYETYWSFND